VKASSGVEPIGAGRHRQHVLGALGHTLPGGQVRGIFISDHVFRDTFSDLQLGQMIVESTGKASEVQTECRRGTAAQ
jgi:hypothetical protein